MYVWLFLPTILHVIPLFAGSQHTNAIVVYHALFTVMYQAIGLCLTFFPGVLLKQLKMTDTVTELALVRSCGLLFHMFLLVSWFATCESAYRFMSLFVLVFYTSVVVPLDQADVLALQIRVFHILNLLLLLLALCIL